MEFKNTPPEWGNEGTEPLADEKAQGFVAEDVLPAPYLNWQWYRAYKCMLELQELLNQLEQQTNDNYNEMNIHVSSELGQKAPLTHTHTKDDVGLDKVNNTADSEKSVAFASEAGVGRKVQYPMTVRFNGGQTEGTDKWTFDGATSKSINLTPEKLGARPIDKPTIVVNAVRGTNADGKEIYTVTDSSITELYDGLEITVIPNEANETLQPRLAINELGDKGIRLALSSNCAATTTVKTNYFSAGRPITLKYHANCNLGVQGQGAWLFADRQKTSAQDLYGSVPVESGGTGASTAEEARENLGAASTQTFEVNVPLAWTTDSTNGGYIQTITLDGILKSDNPIVDIVLGTNISTNRLHLEAWGCVSRITTANGSITLYANEVVPETAFNIQLKVVR